jgi:ElaB/YqjD/DUF883 family membrane-anchored ribosome-binding protein
MGKGSAPRPYSVDADTFESNWDKIFKKEEAFQKLKETIKEHSETFEMLAEYDGQLTDEQYEKIKERTRKNYQDELKKANAEVEKRFLDGISKPNESQFDGDKPNTVKS